LAPELTVDWGWLFAGTRVPDTVHLGLERSAQALRALAGGGIALCNVAILAGLSSEEED